MLPDDIVKKFNEAKVGNFDAVDYFVAYFINNVEKQLQNLDLIESEKAKKIFNCRRIVLKNLYICYDANNFVSQTLKEIKNAIYLNQVAEPTGSEEIVNSQKTIIQANLSVSNLDLIKLDVKDRELARLFYLENKSVKDLAEMYKCSERIIFVRLRRAAEALTAQRATNQVSKR